MPTFTDEQIAEIAHGANKALCEAVGDFSQKPWADAEPWQRVSALKGVRFAIDNPGEDPDAGRRQHDAWSADKIADGWTYGNVKDPAAKTHPCLVPFDQLPPEQQAKDPLFRAVVRALTAGG